MSVSRTPFRSHVVGKADAPVHARRPNVLFQRIVIGDRSAVKECIDKYGNWIWKIATTFGKSQKDAENLSCELFEAIWKNAERISNSPIEEKALIPLIASVELRSAQRSVEEKVNC